MRVAPRVAAAAYGDKVYLAHLPDGPIHVLDGTAALIWSRALAVPRARLAADLLDKVEGEPATVQAEVSAFLDMLIRQRLLVEDGEA